MPVSLLAALLIVVLAVAFSLQNAQSPISIQFLGWTYEGSLVLVLLSTLCIGMLIHFLATMPARFRKSRQISQLERRIFELERSIVEKTKPPIH